MVIFLFWSDCIASYKNQYTSMFFFVFRCFFDHLYMKKQRKTKKNTDLCNSLQYEQYPSNFQDINPTNYGR